MNHRFAPIKEAKRLLREGANALLALRGMEIVHQSIERFPHKQLMHAIRHFEVDLVIDVGANTGQFAMSLIKEGFDGPIHSLEPLPDAHRELTAAAAPHPQWIVHERVAVGPEEGVVDLWVAGNSVSSSVLDMLDLHVAAAPGSAPVGRITVPQKPLDDLIGGVFDVPRRGLLKIDAQGYEYPILTGASVCLDRVALVMLEMSLQPLYRDQMLWLDVIAFMRSRGFGVWALQPEFCDARTGQLLQVNGVFARETDDMKVA
jgi:FkbM family methyltransferase